MNRIHYLYMFLLNCICVPSSDIPTNTGILPLVEFLDSKHVLANYSASFDIPDFSQVNTVAVYVGDKFMEKQVETILNPIMIDMKIDFSKL